MCSSDLSSHSLSVWNRRSRSEFDTTNTEENAIATPAIIAAADPTFEPYVEVATAQVASAVLVSAVLAPLLAAWVLKRQGGLKVQDEEAESAPLRPEGL